LLKSKYIILLLILLIGFFSCQENNGERKIVVLHAGSLSVPFNIMAREFMEIYPNITVIMEAHGSRTCARQITDLGRSIDVMASADSKVIQNLLIPDHAEFCINFATNEMAIMYKKSSLFADKINPDNWFDILLLPEVEYGRSDPNADPCGYRTLLTWQLAEKFYAVPGLYKRLSDKMPKRNIRAKEVDLIALLEAGELDYIFIYRSVAWQHQALFLSLPDEINLRSSVYKDFYHNASVKISGKKPGEWIVRRGAPMVYGITLPLKSQNPNWGIKFIAFVLSKRGREIMAQNGQPPVFPAEVDHKNKLPALLKTTFTSK